MQTEMKPLDELLSLRPKDRVRVMADDGSEADYEVKYEPWTLAHGEWVIGLKGIAGGYKLSRVVKVLERMNAVLCVICRRENPNPSCSACPTCIPPDEGEIRLQGTVATLTSEVNMLNEANAAHIRIRERYTMLLRKAVVELVVIDPRRNPPRDRLVTEIEKALGETWSQASDILEGR